MTRRNVFALSLALVGAEAHAGDPRDYAQWRGPSRDGSASAFSEPPEWPEALTLQWKADVGEGYATPLVIGDTVYSFTRREGDEVMAALNVGTGKELWHTGYSASYTPARPVALHGSGPKATPAFLDGKLFTLGISGIVAAFEATSGRLLWRTNAPEESPFFSAASSPIAEQGIVIAHPGNYGPLTAFDAETGIVQWTAGDGGFFASPIVAEIDGSRQVITVTQESVIGVSPDDGAILWQFPWEGGQGGPTPVISGESIVVSGNNLGVAAFRPTRSNGEWTTETLWNTNDVSMYLSSPVLIDDTLFGFSQRASGQYFALDARTGQVLWLGQARQAKNTAVSKAKNLLFLLNDNAELIVARGSRTGIDPFRRYTVADSDTWAQPAISGNRLLIKDVSSLRLWTVD